MNEDLKRAAVHASLASACFALMGAAAKAASKAGVNDFVVVFARNVIAVTILGPWLLRRGVASLKTARFSGHLWRSLFGLLGMYSLFYAISHLSLAEALLLNYSSPLFIPFLAWWVLGERPALFLVPASVLGLLGVALIVKPTLASVSTASLVGAASGVFAACAMVSLRRISNTEPASRVVFYFAAIGLVVSSVPMLWFWQALNHLQASLLLATGVCATAGQLQLTKAYSFAPAARVGAMGYAGVVFAGLLGWLIWDERQDGYSLLGASLVISTCVLASLQRPKNAPPITPEDAST